MTPLEKNGTPRIILLDIEGTTTPPEYVQKVVYPFIRENLRNFLLRHEEDPTIVADIEALRKQHAAESRGHFGLPDWTRDMPINSTINYVDWLMEHDSRNPGLKALQGRILVEAYVDGMLRGEVYPDVRPALERWAGQDRANCIYSSGSVLEQKLLFTNSTAGDLSGFLRAYFDSMVGGKQETESYRKIAEELASPANEVLFISDVVEELEAASAAGMQTALCSRANGVAVEASGGLRRVVRSLNEIFP
ncbi:MAG: acireductone synthase [Candidatus Acidiferrales bacterium]